MALDEAQDGGAAPRSAARMGMAARWLGIICTLSLVLAVVGPRLEDSLPKGVSMQRPATGKTFFSANFEGIFRTHAISLPKRAGERRVAFVGNSALARAHFAEALRGAVAARDPDARTYGLAWPGLNALGQGLFVRRAAAYDIDVLLWAISPVDCVDAPGAFVPDAPPLALSLGTGVGAALGNFRLLGRDNAYIVLFNLLGTIFPHVRYGTALAEAAPPLPTAALERRGPRSVEGEATARPKAVPLFTRRTHPPATALRVLDATRPLLAARGTRVVILVMPHHEPDAWFGPGPGQLQEFVAELRGWAARNDSTVIDLSGLLPDSAFWDGVHFNQRFDAQVGDAIAESLFKDGPR